MNAIEWALQILLLGLLLGAIPFALRLERALAAIRRDRGALEGGSKEFQEAASLAEAAVQRLRAAAEQAGRQVSERIAVAEPLRDDLRYLVERAEAQADRLDGLVRAARPAAPEMVMAAPAERPAPARSQAERDLLRALVQGVGRAP